MRHQNTNCNCCECIWNRIVLCSKDKIVLTTIRGVQTTYNVEKELVIWQTIGPNQNVLYNQSKKQICNSLNARILNYGPSKYPGTATSYKWALLNHPKIWIQ
jgi:hypothetical protein